MSQLLPYDEIGMWHGHPDLYWKKFEEFLNTPDDAAIGYFVEVDLKYPDEVKGETKTFQFAPEKKITKKDDFIDYMKKIKPDVYTQTKKLICDWTNKKKYLIQYRTLKFFIRHGMIVEKIHESFSFKQSRWLEKYISFDTQKRSRARNQYEKDFYKLLNNAAFTKMMENVRNRLRLELYKKNDTKKIIKQQTKSTFIGIHKSFENCDSYIFKQEEILTGKPIYVGFVIIE